MATKRATKPFVKSQDTDVPVAKSREGIRTLLKRHGAAVRQRVARAHHMLVARVRELEADAARLDWLDAMLWSPGDADTEGRPYIGDVRLSGSWTPGRRRAVQVGDDNQPIYSRDTIRDAIDVARAAWSARPAGGDADA